MNPGLESSMSTEDYLEREILCMAAVITHPIAVLVGHSIVGLESTGAVSSTCR
jgi:hypothetical protein